MNTKNYKRPLLNYAMCLLIALSFNSQSFGQSPNAIPYQGVARDAAGTVLPLQAISIEYIIHDVTAAGTIVFSETHNITTTSLGLFNLNIGEGSPVTGSLATVDWGNGAKFIEVVLDGTSMGTSQLNSVPYALYAASSGGDFVDLTTDQSIDGNKTFNNDLTVNGINIGKGAGNIATNTANGLGALGVNTTGTQNTAIGNTALSANTIGGNNVAVGYLSLRSNTIGVSNTAIGVAVLRENINGWDNTGIGIGALELNTSGFQNIAQGTWALHSNTTGARNTGVGINALISNITGNDNTAFGFAADVSANNLTNATAIGANSRVDTSNSLVLGNNVNVGIGTSSPNAKLHLFGNGDYGTGTRIVFGDDYYNGSNFGTRPYIGEYGWEDDIDSDALILHGSGKIYFSTGGLRANEQHPMVLWANNVGLGTDFPTEKLDIIGRVKITDGTEGAGKVLTSNATGVATWQDATAGGDFVDLATNQTISGTKIFNEDATINYVTIGRGAGSEPYYSTALGYAALGLNTTGSSNTAVGYNVLSNNTTGGANIAVGGDGLSQNTTGDNNTAIGPSVMGNNINGSFNTGVGQTALYGNVSGSFNTALGVGATVTSGNLSNATAIGAEAKVSASNSLVLGNNANVGIGTSAPTARLQIGDIHNQNDTYATVMTAGGNQYKSGLGLYHFNVNVGWLLESDESINTFSIKRRNSQFGFNNPAFSIDGAENIGIGTPTPAAKLDVVGNIKITDGTEGAGKVLTSDATGVASWQDAATGGSFVDLTTNQNIDGTKTFNANVGIGTPTPAAKLDVVGNVKITDGTQGAGKVLTSDATGVASWQDAATGGDFVDLATNQTISGTKIFNDNVGIGTTTPAAKLDVIGNVKITDGTQGAGKVLTSNDTGVASWQDAATGGGGTIDDAYNFGGAGQGRFVNAYSGTFAVNGFDGFVVTGSQFSGKVIGAANGIPSGSGARMFFNPNKIAFRAGQVDGSQWDNANVGIGSIALGYNTIASGSSTTALGHQTTASNNYSLATGIGSNASASAATAMGEATRASGRASFAIGTNTNASGLGATAIGNQTTASGSHSVAMGFQSTSSGSNSFAAGSYSKALGESSIALGTSTASQAWAFATGYSSKAEGQHSAAIGRQVIASGSSASAMGYLTIASGLTSTAFGYFSNASGDYSTVFGDNNSSPSYAETTVGRYATTYTPASATSWNLADRLFTVGNGPGARSDALVVLKNGQTGIDIDNFQANTTGEKLQVNGTVKANMFKVKAMNIAPASATATGTTGEIRVTSTHIYVCTSTNVWVRAELATW